MVFDKIYIQCPGKNAEFHNPFFIISRKKIWLLMASPSKTRLFSRASQIKGFYSTVFLQLNHKLSIPVSHTNVFSGNNVRSSFVTFFCVLHYRAIDRLLLLKKLEN